jgi:hypothetical protein
MFPTDFLEIIIEIINQNSGLMTLLFSGVVAVSTFFYAILTWKLVSETRKTREAQTEPKIEVRIWPREEYINFFDLIIENIGSGPAYDIHFKLEGDFEYMKGKYISELAPLKNGIKYLGPRQKIQWFLTNMVEDSEIKLNTSFTVNMIYKNAVGRKYEERFPIDFSHFRGLLSITPPLIKIADSVGKIEREIRSISDNLHGLINIEKKDEFERERRIKESFENSSQETA